MKSKIMKYIAFFLFITNAINAQQYDYQYSIGKFLNASSFYVAASGIIYVTDSGNDQITSLDTLGNILQTTGGYGWTEATFDEPVDVFATPLNVYVTDKNNHRIQRFDRDLNFISSLSTKDGDNKEARFGYPLGCAISNQGDMYILDSENQRVIKFDLFGNFIQNFGGFDAGSYMLENPKSLAVSSNNLIFVLDESGIVIFDSFGNGVGNIEIEDKSVSLRILFDNLTFNSINKIFTHNLRTEDQIFNEVVLDFKDLEIVSSLFYNDKLYVLTAKEILIFSALN